MVKKLFPGNFDWSRSIDRLYGSDILRSRVDLGVSLEEIVEETGIAQEKKEKRIDNRF